MEHASARVPRDSARGSHHPRASPPPKTAHMHGAHAAHTLHTRCTHAAHMLHTRCTHAAQLAQMLQALDAGLSCAQSPPIPDGINSQHCPCCQPHNSFEDHGAETCNIAASMRTAMNYDLLTRMMLIFLVLDMQNRKGTPTRVDLKQTEST